MGEVLAAASVTAGYGESTVLHNVSLQLSAGRICCILGRNGVGKTTLIQTIAGHLPLRHGRISLNGEDISNFPPFKRSRLGMSLAPQGRRLFGSLTVREHLEIAQRAAGAGKAAWTIDRVTEAFPRLSERIDNLGVSLSGGEQSMASIARLLVSNPTVALFDEPSEGLSPILVQRVAEVLRVVRSEGLAILLVEQNVKLAMQIADEIHLMNKGKIVFSGTPAEFTADEETRQKYLGGVEV